MTRVESYGVFVQLDGGTEALVDGPGGARAGAGVNGMAHVSEVADEFIKDLTARFTVGDLVKAVVLKIDGKRVSLGLKPSYFEGDSDMEDDDDDDDDDAEDGEEEDDDDEEEEDDDEEEEEEDGDDEEDEVRRRITAGTSR